MRWRSWLRHCAKSQKIMGLIPDGITGIFNLHNSSGCPVALGLTQSLTEMSTRNISWRSRCPEHGLTTLLPSCADCLEIRKPQLPGTLRTCPGLYRDCYTFYLFLIHSFCTHFWDHFSCNFTLFLPSNAISSVLYTDVKEEISFSRLCGRLYSFFFFTY